MNPLWQFFVNSQAMKMNVEAEAGKQDGSAKAKTLLVAYWKKL